MKAGGGESSEVQARGELQLGLLRGESKHIPAFRLRNCASGQ